MTTNMHHDRHEPMLEPISERSEEGDNNLRALNFHTSNILAPLPFNPTLRPPSPMPDLEQQFTYAVAPNRNDIKPAVKKVTQKLGQIDTRDSPSRQLQSGYQTSNDHSKVPKGFPRDDSDGLPVTQVEAPNELSKSDRKRRKRTNKHEVEHSGAPPINDSNVFHNAAAEKVAEQETEARHSPAPLKKQKHKKSKKKNQSERPFLAASPMPEQTDMTAQGSYGQAKDADKDLMDIDASALFNGPYLQHQLNHDQTDVPSVVESVIPEFVDQAPAFSHTEEETTIQQSGQGHARESPKRALSEITLQHDVLQPSANVQESLQEIVQSTSTENDSPSHNVDIQPTTPATTTSDAKSNGISTSTNPNGHPSRVLKRKQHHPKGPAANQTQTPTIEKALKILQWTWEQEKQRVEEKKCSEVESYRQKFLDSERNAAASAKVADMLFDRNEELQRHVEQNDLKLAQLIGDFKKLDLSRRGLSKDIDKGRADFMKAQREINNLKETHVALKAAQQSANESLSNAESEVRALKLKHGQVVESIQISAGELRAENAELRSQLLANDRLLTLEKERVASVEQASMEGKQLQNHITELLDKNNEHVLLKLQEISAVTTSTSREDEMLQSLRAMVEEIHSRNIGASDQMVGLEQAFGLVEQKMDATIEKLRNHQVREAESQLSETSRTNRDFQNLSEQLTALRHEIAANHSAQQQLAESVQENKNIHAQMQAQVEAAALIEQELGKVQHCNADLQEQQIQERSKNAQLETRVRELKDELDIVQNDYQASHKSDSSRKTQVEKLRKTIKDLEIKLQSSVKGKSEAEAGLMVKLSEQKATMEEVSKKQLQEHASESLKAIAHLEAKVSRADQSLKRAREQHGELVKATQSAHNQQLENTKQEYILTQERLKKEFAEKLSETSKHAMVEARKSFEKAQADTETKLHSRIMALEQKLQAESEKFTQLQKSLHDVKQAHERELQSEVQKATTDGDQLRSTLVKEHDEAIRSIQTQFSQVQLENEELKAKDRHTSKNLDIVSLNTNHSVNAEDHTGITQNLDNLLNFDEINEINNEATGITQLMRDAGLISRSSAVEDPKVVIQASQSTPRFQPNVKRLTDLAAELEPSNTFEVDDAIGAMFDFTRCFMDPVTPAMAREDSNQLREGDTTLLCSDDNVFGNNTAMIINPFTMEKSNAGDEAHQSESHAANTSRKSYAVPFDISRMNSGRSSVPPSTSGSMDSGSVLAGKGVSASRNHGTPKTQSINEGIDWEKKIYSRIPTPGLTASQPGFLRPPPVADNKRKRAPSMDGLKNGNKKSATTSSLSKTQRIPLNDISNRTHSTVDQFKIIGSPHMGQFGYNRPPTAGEHPSSNSRSGSRGRGVMKRTTEVSMVARFDQELKFR